MSAFTILAVFAHPDDEAFGMGGTLSHYAAQGHNVYLITATRGEAGNISVPDLATFSNLPLVREKELICACQIYGINPPIFLNFQDGQLPIVHQGQAVAKLVRIIRELKPQVLITFGPDGIYGHYDHIAVHRWATIAFDLAADPGCFPDLDLCKPHQIQKLYYLVLTDDQIAAMSQDDKPASIQIDGVPFSFTGYPKSTITTIIDISDQIPAKRRGIQCHTSQVGLQNQYLEEIEEYSLNPFFDREYFILARTLTKRETDIEIDLLAGLDYY